MKKLKIKLNIGNAQADNLSIANLSRRVKSKTPPFWKKVGLAGKIMIGIAGIIAAPATGGVSIPAALVTISTVLASVGSSIVLLSTLPTIDNFEPLASEDNEQK